MKIKSLLPLSLVLILSACGQTLRGEDISKEEFNSFLTSFDYLKSDHIKSYKYEIDEKVESKGKTEKYKIAADYKVSDKETTLKMSKGDDYSYYTLTDEMVTVTYRLDGKEGTITYNKSDSLSSYETMANTICVDSLIFNHSYGFLAPHGFIYLAKNSQVIELADDSSRFTKDNSFYYASMSYSYSALDDSLISSTSNDYKYLKFDSCGVLLEAESLFTSVIKNEKTVAASSYKCSIEYRWLT